MGNSNEIKLGSIKKTLFLAINGTPIIDIKPVFNEYLPIGAVKQPKWTNNLMKNYCVLTIVHLMIMDEEKYLIQQHGDLYINYKDSVNRYFSLRFKNK